mgnify:CR=1 FL=1|jgi:hypothetical protein
MKALTKSRSASYHRQTMLKIVVAALVLYVAWEPIRPLRVVTADIILAAQHELRK